MTTLKTVNQMYQITKANSTPLLSSYGADFWKEYVDNYVRYDKVFRRMYLDFKYFLQDGTEEIEDLTSEFTADVLNLLMINRKKYEELYRIYVVSDDEDMLTDNYNIKEVMDRDTTSNKGINETVGVNSTVVDNGNTTDVTQPITNTSIDKSSPYDDTDEFHNTYENTSKLGERNNATTTTNSRNIESATTTTGVNTDEGTEDYTLTKVGNIGVQTSAEMLTKHKKFWNSYEFYSAIFKDICRELLII